MESAHAEAAVLLIEAGADRGRVRTSPAIPPSSQISVYAGWPLQANVEDTTPENVDGVGGEEQRRVKLYVIDRCGPP